jgi:chemotaxis protein histidine kinase CheA
MDDVLRQVVGVFAEEVKEQAHRIAAAVLAMDGDPAAIPLQVEELYRQAHSLKGSSSSLGVTELEILAHTLEDAWLPIRRARGRLSATLVDASLRAMDAARLRAAGLVADDAQGLDAVQKASSELAVIASGEESATVAAAEEPEAEPAAAPVAATEGGETLRVAAEHLSSLERRIDELRQIRDRFDHRTSTVSALIQTLERMWHKSRGDKKDRDSVDALYHVLRQLSAFRRDLIDDAERSHGNLLQLEESLLAMRMVPASLLREPLARAVRDTCRRTDKDARFEFDGGDAQIDRRLLEQLKSPLLHLVRNAVDHGLEPTVVREAMGKSARAQVRVSVEQRGREVLISVRDDGRGIDGNKVRRKAIDLGLVGEAEAERLADRELHELLFRPGFSTADEVTEVSGRGVGLDVVRDAILRLQGRIELLSQPGSGTEFQLVVPLTIASSEVMLIEECGRTFALPLSSIVRIVRAANTDLRLTGGRAVFHYDEQSVPVVRLSRLLGLTEQHDGSAFRTVALLRSGEELVALVCERLLGWQDLVMRPLPAELQSLKLLSTAAILPNGQPIFVLSPRALVETATVASEERAERAAQPGTILVADDSITTRSLLRNTLETSGFRVRIATDGDEALRLAFAETFDLIVSDVRMPRLDGFSLTARLRADPRTARVPVVLFSSLDSDEDRRRGSASGANAYLTKGAFDRGQLLDVIGSLIRGAS